MRSNIILAFFLIWTLVAGAQEKRDTIRSVSQRKGTIAGTDRALKDSSSMNRREKVKRLQAEQKDIMEQLDLSREQKKKLKEANSSIRDQLKELKENQTLSKREKGQKVKELMKEREARMESILNEQQLKKYRELTKNRTGNIEMKD